MANPKYIPGSEKGGPSAIRADAAEHGALVRVYPRGRLESFVAYISNLVRTKQKGNPMVKVIDGKPHMYKRRIGAGTTVRPIDRIPATPISRRPSRFTWFGPGSPWNR